MHSGGHIEPKDNSGGDKAPKEIRRSTITSYDRAIEFFNKGNITEAIKYLGATYKLYPNQVGAHELLYSICQLIHHGHLDPAALDIETQNWIGKTNTPLKKQGLFTTTYEVATDLQAPADERVDLYNGINTAEKACIYALALYFKKDKDLAKAKQIAGLFLNKFYLFMPNDIPDYLREPFIRMLIENVDGVSNIGHWKTMFLKDMDTVKEVKKQFLAVIDSLRDDGLKQLALWDCLCEDTFLGEVFHIKRGIIRFPSIARKDNELNTAIIMLSNLISKPNCIIHADNHFVREKLLRNPDFMEDVKQFPAVEFVLKPRGNANQPR